MQEIYDEAEKIKADVTVLIVEDEDMQRESIARQLKDEKAPTDSTCVCWRGCGCLQALCSGWATATATTSPS